MFGSPSNLEWDAINAELLVYGCMDDRHSWEDRTIWLWFSSWHFVCVGGALTAISHPLLRYGIAIRSTWIFGLVTSRHMTNQHRGSVCMCGRPGHCNLHCAVVVVLQCHSWTTCPKWIIHIIYMLVRQRRVEQTLMGLLVLHSYVLIIVTTLWIIYDLFVPFIMSHWQHLCI